MAHLRKYTAENGLKYFDPKCVDGIDVTAAGQFSKIITIHLISGGDAIHLTVLYNVNIEAWVQTNIIDIAGENPDITGCL